MLNITVIAVIIVIVTILIVILVIALYLKLKNEHNYFIAKDNVEKDEAELYFYIKKHTIFRLCFLAYSITHYLLNIISIIFSMVTIYMVLDKSIDSNLQAVFLLVAAISTNLSISLRLDCIAEGYAQAMRIMEYAILNYIRKGASLYSLCEANKKAEECIGNKFI